MPTVFQENVYDLVRKIPKGKVTTYKYIAEALGTGAYRAVGSALRSNPYAPEVPCHRVIASDRTIGGFCGEKRGPEIQRKIDMLAKEGVVLENGKVSSQQIHRFTGST